MGNKRSKSSRRWLDEHVNDPFVQRANREGWRSRAVFKLEEVDLKERLIKQGMRIIDLGAAPGGWSQYAARKLKGNGYIIALDLLEMAPLDGVEFIQGDFREEEILQKLLDSLAGKKADLVMSDMAPNISGMAAVDQPRGMHLAELSLDLCREALAPGGALLVKVFQGVGFQELLTQMRGEFDKVKSVKPKASRPRSREIYLLAQGYALV